MQNKISVVTGGAGFIGSHMVDLLLKEGYHVRVLDNLVGGRLDNLAHHRGNQNLKVEVRDVVDVQPGDALFHGAEYVFHFAGIGDIVPSIERPRDYMRTNVQGTVAALEGARHAGAKKFVYAASSSCYGICTELPTTEHAPISPEYPYALSKYQGEQAVLHWGKVYKLPVNVNPHLQRLRASFQDDGCLRSGVRRLPGPETGQQAVHGGGRRQADARLHLCRRPGPGVSGGGEDQFETTRSSMSGPAIRSRSIGSSS